MAAKIILAWVILTFASAIQIHSDDDNPYQAPEPCCRDEDTLQRFNMGMFFKRVASMTLYPRKESLTFAVPRPTLEDLQPGVNQTCPLVGRNVTCSAMPFLNETRTLMETAFKALNVYIDTLPCHNDRIQASAYRVNPPRLPRFRVEYPENFTRPYLLSPEPSEVFDSVSFLTEMTTRAYNRFRNSYLQLHRKRLRMGPMVTLLGNQVNELRAHLSKQLQDVWELFEDDVYLLNDQPLADHAVWDFVRQYRESLQALRSGTLTPFLIPKEEVVEAMKQFNEQAAKRRSPYMAPEDPELISYGGLSVSTARDDVNIYVTVTFDVTVNSTDFDVYKVNTFPLYITSDGYTRLTGVSPYLAVAKDDASFIEMSADQFKTCSEDDGQHCGRVLQVGEQAHSPSCLWALYRRRKYASLDHCYMEVAPTPLSPSAVNYAKGWLLLTKISNVTYVKVNDSRHPESMAACPTAQCVVEYPCRYWVKADEFTFPPVPFGCEEKPLSRVVRFPLNLQAASQVVYPSFLYPQQVHNLNAEPAFWKKVTFENLAKSKMISSAAWKNTTAQVNFTFPKDDSFENPLVSGDLIVCILCYTFIGIGMTMQYAYHDFISKKFKKVQRKLRDEQFGVMIRSKDIPMVDLSTTKKACTSPNAQTYV